MAETTITAKQITEAAAAAIDDPSYRQDRWFDYSCGTACCVLGRARLLAGVAPADTGPRAGEIPGGPDGPLGRLLSCSGSGVASLLAQATISSDGDIAASHAILIDVDLRGADLRGVDLSEADVRGADLSESDLRWADLRWADLREADLRGALFRGALLRWADLHGADLREADLRGAKLGGADLRGVDLSEALLRANEVRLRRPRAPRGGDLT